MQDLSLTHLILLNFLMSVNKADSPNMIASKVTEKMLNVLKERALVGTLENTQFIFFEHILQQ